MPEAPRGRGLKTASIDNGAALLRRLTINVSRCDRRDDAPITRVSRTVRMPSLTRSGAMLRALVRPCALWRNTALQSL